MPQPTEPAHSISKVETMSTEYVVGLLYENSPLKSLRPTAILMRKNHPEWQKGKLNGVGGKIQNHESPDEAMHREWNEEVNCPYEIDWELFCVLNDHSGGAVVFFFRSHMPKEAKLDEFKATEDEPLVAVDITRVLKRGDMIWNIPWLLHMGMDYNIEISKVSCTP